ncbi:MAG: DUF6348 family protein [Ruminococcus sp.]|nr:DUF6348 family protein [Ruminococcus sp.]
MALFKKKNKGNEEAAASAEQGFDYQAAALEALNAKLNGTLYDGCIIMPRGITIDVKIGKKEERENIKSVQFMFLVSSDSFDEPIIDPVDAHGPSDQEVVNMAVEIFYGGLWHPIDQSLFKKNPVHVPVTFLGQHYDFDMYAHSIVRIGVEHNNDPKMLIAYIANEIPKYLGSKKYYWIRIFLAKQGDRQIVEARVNGSVCYELAKPLTEYVNTWEKTDSFRCEKQFAIFVNRAEDECPFKKEQVVEGAKFALERMVKISNPEEYQAFCKDLDEFTGNKDMATELRIFIPEIFAKLTLGYEEGDSLFLLTGDPNSEEGGNRLEFRKTQLRSYFYIQQTILEYLGTRPPQEDVQRIVFNSVAFRELRKAKEQGHEPKDLYVPGTAYRIGNPDYKVW